MKYYLAPMEGITGFVFRNAYHDYFAPMDKYFTPFISPNQNICFTPKEYRDICPDNNRIPNVIPQILTNKPEDFIKTAGALAEMGYEEVNLNLGCPSGTVTAKHKGAGFLTQTERLRAFFDRIFEKPQVRISVKTRLGMYSPDEFSELLAIFNAYPLEELIIHPRIRQEFYDGTPHRDVYLAAAKESANPLCYNGDLFCAEDVRALAAGCREAESVACAAECREAEKAACAAGAQEAEKAACATGAQEAESAACAGPAEAGRETGTESAGREEARNKAGGKTAAVMLGRGVLRDPWLVSKCREAEKNGEMKEKRYSDPKRIQEFSARLFSDYAQYMGEHNAMFRMKELWLYLAEAFADADANRRKIKKAQSGAELAAVVQGLRPKEGACENDGMD